MSMPGLRPDPLAGTPAFEQSRQCRRRIEKLVARLKRILKTGHLLPRVYAVLRIESCWQPPSKA